MYPLRLHRIAVKKPWAGDRLRVLFPEQAAEVPPSTGEWIELRDLPGASSVVTNGEWRDKSLAQLMRTHKAELLGDLAESALDDFPLCVKLLDTNEALSIQDHPHDSRDGKRLIKRGKSECWIVLDAARDAVIYQGLREGVRPEDFELALDGGEPATLMNARAVKPGDFLYNQAGMIHAIGGGVALLEIQQNCPTTYRLWDFPRAEKREMHINEGLGAARFNLPLPPIHPTHREDEVLAPRGPFGVRSVRLSKPTQDPKQWPGFTVHTCLQGECEITAYARDKLEPAILKRGETVLWPAIFDKFEYFPRGDCWLIQSWARE